MTFKVGRHGADLEQLIPAFNQDHSYHIPTRGEWSLHEMLEFVLHRIGPAKVWLTSWGISQAPLNRILELQRTGVITELRCLFDSRVKLECPQAYQLTMASTAVVRLGKNHSKLGVLINDHWGVTVNTSANLTVNPRLEYYTISTHRELARFNSTWIDLELEGAQPFENE